MKKIYTYILIYIVAMMLFTACSGDDVITEQGGVEPIGFNISTANLTRSEGEVGLSSFVNDFRVYSMYGNESGGTFTPTNTDFMTNWVVWYDQKTSSNTSATNTNSWEYVGSYVGSTSDGTMSDLSSDENKTAIAAQQIRYWDDTQSHYIFWALAKADRGTFTYNESAKTVTTTLDLSNPATAFYADPVVVAKADYGKAVKLVFHRFVCQVRVGFYETIPGYVVKDVMFYATKDATSANEDGEVFLLGTNSFSTYSSTTKATITSTYTTSPTTETTISEKSSSTSQSFGGLNYSDNVQENLLTAGTYLNLSSTAPTYATSMYMFPGNAGPITIKCDYTLVANDHAKESDNETIHVTGATATVPSDYCNWESNKVYTYVFKISENTNGQTGAGYAGLYPITFDAEASSETEWNKTYELK